MTFSIIITTWNSAAFIERSARSALAQTYPAKEVIVVDPSSPDNTADVARAIPGIRLLTQPNQGVCAARNMGVAAATGDWLLFLEHDDELFPDALAAYRDSINNAPGFLVHYGKILTEPMAGGPTRISGTNSSEGPVPTAALTNFYRVQIITPGGILMRRDFYNKLGGFSSDWDFGSTSTEDQDLFIRAGLETEFKFCDHLVCLKHFYGGNASANWRTTTLGSYRRSLHHLRAIRTTGKFPQFNRITESMILDLAIRRSLKYKNEPLLREVLAIARTDGVSSLWSRLFGISFKLGIAYRHLRHWLGHYSPALHRRFNYGTFG